jgi:integrase
MKNTTLYTQMDEWIDAYLDDKKLAWSRATLRSERHRLNGMAPALKGFDASKLWAYAQEHGAYTRATMFSRAASFYDWLMEEGKIPAGPNPYKRFRRKNALQFKNVYQKKPAQISYAEAEARIAQIKDEGARQVAQTLLRGGLRFAEYSTFDGTQVVGKGNKPRRVYLDAAPAACAPAAPSYFRVRRALAAVQLRPHTLRKVFATAVAEAGADAFTLMGLMGWSNLNTATSYIEASEQKKESFARIVQGGTKNGNDDEGGGTAA